MTVNTVTVAGISGRLGALVARSILGFSPSVTVQGLVRNKAKVPSDLLGSSRVTVTEIGNDLLASSREACKGAQSVVCCYLGPNDFMVSGQKTLIDAAVAEGVPRYLASDYSLDFRKLEYGDIPTKDPMKDITAYLDSTVKDKIHGVHVLNGAFSSILTYSWNKKYSKLFYWGTGNEKWDTTTYETSAEYIAKIALDETATGWLKVLGDKISFKELANAIEEVHGVSPDMVCLGSLPELKEKMDKARKEGNITWKELSLFYSYYMSTGQTDLGKDLDNGRYPDVRSETVKEFLAREKKGSL